MDFTLSTEEKEVRDWVRTFVRREIIPLEPDVLRKERSGQPGLTLTELAGFQANEDQKRRYLLPTIEGERHSCFAITEPGAGSDARNIRTHAYPDGTDWIITGEKTFITGGNEA